MATSAIITFSNNEELKITEDEYIIPIEAVEKNGTLITYKKEPYLVLDHSNDGLIPSLTKVISGCAFFSKIDESDKKVYSSSSVVKITNL
ncbi:hypothetical protein ACI2JA_15535 [Alkalihalobacillus sp. NPDC078783]